MRKLISDVVVVGGGVAGVSAAIAAADTGAKTILVDRNPYYGGQATHSQVAAFCGFYTRGAKPDLAVGGVGGKVLEYLEKNGFSIDARPSKTTGNSTVKFDPEILKIIFDQMLKEYGVDCYLHTALVGAKSELGQISHVICSDDEGLIEVSANSFVDATGNANLVNLAGLPTVWGDEEGNVQQSSLCFRLNGLPKREVTMVELEEAIKKAKEVGFQGLYKEKGMIIKKPNEDFGYCTIPSVMVEDLSGKTLTRAEMNLRSQVFAYTKAFKSFIPDFSNIEVVISGPEIGIREARKIIGEKILLGKDILAAKKVNDSIGRAAWSPELHKGDTSLEYRHIPDNEYASIPLGTLKVKECQNLWAAGRIISSDSLAFGSVRVMGTGFVTGQAAGVAAALSTNGKEVNIKDIQNELLAQNAKL
ncbi:FAD-dependent oxidoreductase [Enterococcus casseliflavus]|uniref:FAD-dependent oxidoreductase n=1 Tax=Enterococcus casseliflavus TaxID=37734 RepID=UPI0012E17A29|nr:FAD-dependent oxidoreductase [Enterococcus casseliflavus]MUN75006.1 FAD-dependent oxidoreductase [Enterococcus casseliflavus]MUN98130.1 FAD-dependent oxidoreductase [Enterococcus casseliflavus]